MQTLTVIVTASLSENVYRQHKFEESDAKRTRIKLYFENISSFDTKLCFRFFSFSFRRVLTFRRVVDSGQRRGEGLPDAGAELADELVGRLAVPHPEKVARHGLPETVGLHKVLVVL